MSYRITPHAQARITERKVPGVWLSSVLNEPQQQFSGNYGREVRQSIFEADGKRWLLRVMNHEN